MVNLSFSQLLIWLVQKEGSEDFSEEGRGADTFFPRKKGGRGLFVRVEKGGNNFF